MDYTVKIGGAAGQGIQTIGGLLGEVFARSGYHVFTIQDYESRVRGGHNFYQIRVSDTRVTSSLESVDILIAMDLESEARHRQELTEGGVMLYDSETLKRTYEGHQMLDVPFKRLAVEEAGGPVMANTVAVGAAMGALGMDTDILESIISERFARKGAEVVEGNINALQAGHAYAKNNCRSCEFLPARKGKRKLLISGLKATGMGALASGLKFYAAYPMTPSTGIMDTIASKATEFGVVLEQAEDEIAAINMALGASFAGVRAATGSSGGGFALMVEGLSLAGMTETPIVIFEAQRPGPATGLPTRTEQADLQFVLYSGHGEFPRVVLAPGSPEQCVMLTNKAFELTEKYQVPVFVLLDQYLGDSEWTYEGFKTEAITYKDHRIRGKEARKIKDYKRYALTDSGVSPLLVPGDGHTHLVIADSDEHDEDGHLIEDAPTRISMVEKRLHKKLPALKAEMSPPIRYGADSADTVLVGWGSTYGALKETVDKLNTMGENACMLLFNEIYPLPEGSSYMGTLGRAAKTVCVESNAFGQFATYFRGETGFNFSQRINRYDGRPLTVGYIMERI